MSPRRPQGGGAFIAGRIDAARETFFFVFLFGLRGKEGRAFAVQEAISAY